MNDLDCLLNEIYRPKPDERLVTCLLGFLLVNPNKFRAFQSRLTYQELFYRSKSSIIRVDKKLYKIALFIWNRHYIEEDTPCN